MCSMRKLEQEVGSRATRSPAESRPPVSDKDDDN